MSLGKRLKHVDVTLEVQHDQSVCYVRPQNAASRVLDAGPAGRWCLAGQTAVLVQPQHGIADHGICHVSLEAEEG